MIRKLGRRKRDMNVLKDIDIKKKPTQEQEAMIKNAKEKPIFTDDEYPEFSDAELLQFKRIVRTTAAASRGT